MTESAKSAVNMLPIIPPMNGPKPTLPTCEASKCQGGPERIPASIMAEPTYLYRISDVEDQCEKSQKS